MAINSESVRWATNDVVDPISGVSNKVAPTASHKDNGLLAGEPFARPYVNYNLNATGEALVDLQEQINALTVSASASIIGTIFGIGAYYLTESSENPATILGVGTWGKVEGRFLVGTDSGDTAFDGVGEQGGSKTHTHANSLSVSNHTLTPSQIPQHSHTLSLQKQGNDKASEGEAYASLNEVAQGDFSGADTRTTSTTGGSQPHNHNLSGDINTSSSLPPYRAINIWRRTA